VTRLKEKLEREVQRYSGRMHERDIRLFVEKLQREAYSVEKQFSEACLEKNCIMGPLEREKSKLLKEIGER